jgi:hypothetical protein
LPASSLLLVRDATRPATHASVRLTQHTCTQEQLPKERNPCNAYGFPEPAALPALSLLLVHTTQPATHASVRLTQHTCNREHLQCLQHTCASCMASIFPAACARRSATGHTCQRTSDATYMQPGTYLGQLHGQHLPCCLCATQRHQPLAAKGHLHGGCERHRQCQRTHKAGVQECLDGPLQVCTRWEVSRLTVVHGVAKRHTACVWRAVCVALLQAHVWGTGLCYAAQLTRMCIVRRRNAAVSLPV